jgi:DnaK suppressor protein
MAQPQRKAGSRTESSPPEIRAQYGEFARRLLERRNEIVGRADLNRRNLDEQVLDSPGDEADVSVIDTSADYFMKLSDAHRRELLEIRAALDRMARGVYGICESCGNPIALERLKNLPYARLDIDCQEDRERKSRFQAPKL